MWVRQQNELEQQQPPPDRSQANDHVLAVDLSVLQRQHDNLKEQLHQRLMSVCDAMTLPNQCHAGSAEAFQDVFERQYELVQQYLCLDRHQPPVAFITEQLQTTEQKCGEQGVSDSVLELLQLKIRFLNSYLNGQLDSLEWREFIEPLKFIFWKVTGEANMKAFRQIVDELEDILDIDFPIFFSSKTLLHFACSTSSFDMVRFLVETRAANVNLLDKHGNSPIFYSHCPVISKFLVEIGGANLSLENENGESAFVMALYASVQQHGGLDFVKTLFEAREEEPALQYGTLEAYLLGTCVDLEVVKYLVEEQNLDVASRHKDKSPLHFASHPDILEYLVAKGADVNCQDDRGDVPITTSFALMYLYGKLQFFIHHGIDLNIQNKAGKPPLVELESMLSIYEDDEGVYFRDPEDSFLVWQSLEYIKMVSALMDATSMRNNLEHLRNFVASRRPRELDFAVCDKEGNTLFMMACANGSTEKANYWHSVHGLDLHAKNHKGMTAVHLAARGGHLDMLKWLVAAPQGMNLEEMDQNGQTFLHWACVKGNIHIVDWYVRKRTLGCDGALELLNQADINGRSSLSAAVEAGYWNVLEWFLTSGHARPKLLAAKHA